MGNVGLDGPCDACQPSLSKCERKTLFLGAPLCYPPTNRPQGTAEFHKMVLSVTQRSSLVFLLEDTYREAEGGPALWQPDWPWPSRTRAQLDHCRVLPPQAVCSLGGPTLPTSSLPTSGTPPRYIYPWQTLLKLGLSFPPRKLLSPLVN